MRDLEISRLGASGSEFLISFNLDVGSGCRHRKAGLELQDPLPTRHTHYWQKGLVLCWLLARGLSASLRGPLHKLLECPHGSWLLGDPRKRKAETVMSFMTKPMEATY